MTERPDKGGRWWRRRVAATQKVEAGGAGYKNAKRQLKDWRGRSAVTEILGKLKYIESRGKLQ